MQAIAITTATAGAAVMLTADPALAAMTAHSHASVGMVRVLDGVVAAEASSGPEAWKKRAVKKAGTGNPGICMDVPRGSQANGTGLITWGCHSDYNQQWTFREVSLPGHPKDVFYEIVGTAESGNLNEKCVQVSRVDAENRVENAVVRQWSCNDDNEGGVNRLWRHYPIGGRWGNFVLQNAGSGLCLTADPANGNKLTQRQCKRLQADQANQSWWVNPLVAP